MKLPGKLYPTDAFYLIGIGLLVLGVSLIVNGCRIARGEDVQPSPQTWLPVRDASQPQPPPLPPPTPPADPDAPAPPVPPTPPSPAAPSPDPAAAPSKPSVVISNASGNVFYQSPGAAAPGLAPAPQGVVFAAPAPVAAPVAVSTRTQTLTLTVARRLAGSVYYALTGKCPLGTPLPAPAAVHASAYYVLATPAAPPPVYLYAQAQSPPTYQVYRDAAPAPAPVLPTPQAPAKQSLLGRHSGH